MEDDTRTWADIEAGHTFAPITYNIDEQAVRDFEAVTGVSHPWQAGASPYGFAIVPPTLPCTDYTLFLSQLLPPIVGLHASHRMKSIRPIPVGSDVRVRCRVTDKFTKRGHRYVTMEYVLDDGEGNTYMTNTITTTVDAYIDPSGVRREVIE